MIPSSCLLSFSTSGFLRGLCVVPIGFVSEWKPPVAFSYRMNVEIQYIEAGTDSAWFCQSSVKRVYK